MKRENLKKLLGDQIGEDVIDKIMADHGSDVEKHKTDIGALTAERDGLKAQLEEANQQIEAFKGMDIEGVKKTADEWKAKAEASQVEAQKQVAQLKFDHALEGALAGAKAKNPKAVKALLDIEQLEVLKDGSLNGLKEQLEKIKSENDFLFESDKPDPKIVTGGQSKSIINDPVILAARKAAGLNTE